MTPEERYKILTFNLSHSALLEALKMLNEDQSMQFELSLDLQENILLNVKYEVINV